MLKESAQSMLSAHQQMRQQGALNKYPMINYCLS
jgi:hypothetical protein